MSCRYREPKVIAHTGGDANREMGNRDGTCQVHVVIDRSDAPRVSCDSSLERHSACRLLAVRCRRCRVRQKDYA